MTETAQPVVEAPIAPATVLPDPPKRAKLGYTLDSIPNPVNNHEQFAYASLVEQRATRAALERLADSVDQLCTLLSEQKSTRK